MGLDQEIAARLAEARLAEWRRLGYGEWRAMLDDKEVRQDVGDDGDDGDGDGGDGDGDGDGERYSVVSYALDDGDGRVGMSVAVDDGVWSAFVPLVRVGIMNADGTFTA